MVLHDAHEVHRLLWISIHALLSQAVWLHSTECLPQLFQLVDLHPQELDHINIADLVFEASIWLAVFFENPEVNKGVQVQVNLSAHLDAEAVTTAIEEFELHHRLILMRHHLHINHSKQFTVVLQSDQRTQLICIDQCR